ncbi:MAG: hypothetical protein EKK32_21005 [Bradyrhizobiaceae bacterium]|jgi:hypothetical protein|nr:putative exported protein of unknown function [Bradyrhizobium sp. BTAi1]RTL97262.1 MAG: hypothetical protein EKK32_21005 [Bradyrhizobiaceae bacterium]
MHARPQAASSVISLLAATATIVVEDNGRVAYAYWLDAEGAIRGDVWLYNRCLACRSLEEGQDHE